jgi:hypothetical protein
MPHATGLLLVLGLSSPASPAAGAAVSVRAESRVVAVQRASPLVTASMAEVAARPSGGGDLAEAARSGAPDARARVMVTRLGRADDAMTRAAIFVLAVPVQVDVGPNRVRVTVRVALP